METKTVESEGVVYVCDICTGRAHILTKWPHQARMSSKLLEMLMFL